MSECDTICRLQYFPGVFLLLPLIILYVVQLTTLQRSVFGLGDATQAVTVTANLGAVRSAERQGVTLEVMSHRAVWLTGL